MISNRMSRTILALSGVVCLCGATAFAQATMNSVGNGSSTTRGLTSNLSGWKGSMTDVEFAKKALEGNLADVQLGKIGVKNGGSDVKQFGQKMVEDNGMLNEQLKPIAAKIGVPMPTELSAQDQAMIASLQGESGKQFDDAYIQAVVADHRRDMLEFGNEARIGKDQALKKAAEDGAQVVKEHLHSIEKIARTHHVEVPDSTSATSPGNPPAMQP